MWESVFFIIPFSPNREFKDINFHHNKNVQFSVLRLDQRILILETWKIGSSHHLPFFLEGKSNFCTVQFSSVTQSCPTLFDPMNHSTPGFPVYHRLLEFTQTHAHQVSDAIQPSHPLLLLLLLPPIPPSIRVFPVSRLFSSGGQSTGVSASASALPMNTQDWSR